MSTRKLTKEQAIRRANRIAPGADDVKLGTTVQELVDAFNAQRAAFNVLVAKLNADAGVTDVDYAPLTTAALRDLGAR